MPIRNNAHFLFHLGMPNKAGPMSCMVSYGNMVSQQLFSRYLNALSDGATAITGYMQMKQFGTITSNIYDDKELHTKTD